MKMMLINVKHFIISLFITLITTVILVMIGMKSQIGTALEIRIDSQNLLFWGIIVILVQLWLGITLLLRHKKIINDLKRISSIGDITQNHSIKILKSMGSLGHEIKKLVSEQNDLAVMRSNRISALNVLNKRLMEDNNDSILLTDTSGIILGLSNILNDKIQKEKGDIIGKNLNEIFPEINFPEVINTLETTKISWVDSESTGIKCDPILDKTGTIQYCFWEFGTYSIVKKLQEDISEKIKVESRSKISTVLRFLSKNRKQK